MQDSNFYITLPSNASMHIYPDNTLAHYTTLLPHRIQLDGLWEAALTEIMYPPTFNNIVGGDIWFEVYIPHNDKKITEVVPEQTLEKDKYFTKYPLPNNEISDQIKRYYIPEGFYENMDSLLVLIGRRIAPHTINYDKNYNRVTITYNDMSNIRLYALCPSLAVILGFHHPPTYDFELVGRANYIFHKHEHEVLNVGDNKTTWCASFHPKLDFFVPSHMYIYCDVVEPNLVGDSFSPLLRIVKIDPKFNHKLSMVNFTSLYYIPVLKREFQTIEINIRDDQGDLIPFDSEKLNVRLHFRRREV